MFSKYKMQCKGFHIGTRHKYKHLSIFRSLAWVANPNIRYGRSVCLPSCYTVLFGITIFISVKASDISDQLNGISCSFHGQTGSII